MFAVISATSLSTITRSGARLPLTCRSPGSRLWWIVQGQRRLMPSLGSDMRPSNGFVSPWTKPLTFSPAVRDCALSASRARAATSAPLERAAYRDAHRSLALSLWERSPPGSLPEDLSGGQAPIRRIDFAADRCIIAPRWLFARRHPLHIGRADRPVGPPRCIASDAHAHTLHATTLPPILARLRSGGRPAHRDAAPRRARSTHRLTPLLCAAQLEAWFTTMPPIIEAANGLQHVYLCGGTKEGNLPP